MTAGRRRWVVAGIAAALVLAGLTGVFLRSGAVADTVLLRPDDRDLVATGRQVYADHCAACHMPDLSGEQGWREPNPDGKLPAPPHDASGHTWHHDDATLFELTKHGVGAYIGQHDYSTDMPAYADLLTDREILAVLSYIKSTWPAEIRALHDEINARTSR